MGKAKRIFIVADISYNPVKMFVNETGKLAKGFIRLGHDVRLFSYCNALFAASPLKSKTFAARFYKSKVDDVLASQVKNYDPDVVYVSFARVLDALASGETAIFDNAEILMPLAVLLAFVISEKHAHSFSAEKLFGNSQGLHPARIEAVFLDYETLRRKTFSKIPISPPNCESWANNFAVV